MQENSIDDVFTSEFRHETVIKFIKDVLNGTIAFKPLIPLSENQEHPILKEYAEISVNIEQYVSGKLKGEELDKVEAEIFGSIISLKIMNIVEERYNKSKIEE